MGEARDDFEGMVERFFGLYGQGEYEGALAMLEGARGRFRRSEAQVMGWKAAVLARLGRVDEALGTLRRAEELGFWYDAQALVGDPDFEALHGDEEFRRLAGRLGERREAARTMRPELMVVEPEGSGPHGVVLALHGNNSNNEATLRYWRPATEMGWLLAAAQSSQPGWASGSLVWNDMERALGEVGEHLAEVRRRYAVDESRVVLGGFSMGGQAAVRAGLEPENDVRGVVAVEAWFNEEALAKLERLARSRPASKARFLLAAGRENTEYFGMAERAAAILGARGTACRVVGGSNRGHDYPAEFEEVLREGLGWIAGQGSGAG